VEIESLSRSGFLNRVVGRFLEVFDKAYAFFTFNSANEMIALGDIVSIRRSELSVWDGKRGRPRSYQIELYADDTFSSRTS
jgi:hypothetical protein